jgi:hypothetical protein
MRTVASDFRNRYVTTPFGEDVPANLDDFAWHAKFYGK